MPSTGIGRWALRLLAVLSLGMAFIGAVTPGIPTTIFVIIAAWAAARSSPRLHAWILGHRVFGPLLRQWEAGTMPRRAKWAATAAMTVAGVIAVLSIPNRWIVAAVIACMVCVAAWLWSRPEP